VGVRKPLPTQPGKAARRDFEYQRNGVRELMMICEPKRGWRDVLLMERRTRIGFAHSMRHIVQRYPDAESIHVVLDNLNTHNAASFYAPFPPAEARAMARKLVFHYTPKHGGWLNIAEIELAVLSHPCLSKRIPDAETLRREIQANLRERNAKSLPVKWQFSIQDARRKLARLYPSHSN
jgi:hypothetical protein